MFVFCGFLYKDKRSISAAGSRPRGAAAGCPSHVTGRFAALIGSNVSVVAVSRQMASKEIAPQIGRFNSNRVIVCRRKMAPLR